MFIINENLTTILEYLIRELVIPSAGLTRLGFHRYGIDVVVYTYVRKPLNILHINF